MLTAPKIPAPPADMEHDKLLQMRLSEEHRRMLDELRKAEADLPSRSEMVRRLIERAAKPAPKKRG